MVFGNFNVSSAEGFSSVSVAAPVYAGFVGQANTVASVQSASQAFVQVLLASTTDVTTGNIIAAATAGGLSNIASTGTIQSLQPANTNQVSVIKLQYYCTISNTDSTQVKCSASIYIPEQNSLKNIVSYKHQTYPDLRNKYIGWERYNETNIANTTDYPSGDALNSEFQLALDGKCVVVVADEIGYGDNNSKYNYLNHDNEVFAQVGAIRALRTFIENNLKNTTNGVTVGTFNTDYKTDATGKMIMNIVQVGYDVGGMFSMSIANELLNVSNDPTNNEKYIVSNIICGAPINIPNIFNNFDNVKSSGYYYYYAPSTSLVNVEFYAVYLLLLYYSSSKVKNVPNPLFKLAGNYILDWFNNNSKLTGNRTDFIIRLASYIRTALAVTTIPADNLLTLANLGSVDITKICDFTTNDWTKIDFNATSDFTNNVKLPNIANVPISIVYSSYDELCSYNNTDGVELTYQNIQNITGKANNNIETTDPSYNPVPNIGHVILTDSTVKTIGNTLRSVASNQFLGMKVQSNKSHSEFLSVFVQSVSQYLNPTL